ncbi:hypothetical protein I4U23_010024 [Adineta vaga]|nr:hypothetical protein I4U23_010024 [Adineta vaga]
MTEDQHQSTRYLIQEKYLSLEKRFTITDNAGTIRYIVNSSFFTMGDKLQISDANGNEVMRIRQDNLHFHLTYRIFSTYSGATERELALIKRTGPMWQHKLQINSINGEYIIEKKGSTSSNEFTLTKNDNVIGIVTKDASPTKTFYWVDIIDSNEQDHALLLAMIIVFSCAQRLSMNPMAKPAIK